MRKLKPNMNLYEIGGPWNIFLACIASYKGCINRIYRYLRLLSTSVDSIGVLYDESNRFTRIKKNFPTGGSQLLCWVLDIDWKRRLQFIIFQKQWFNNNISCCHWLTFRNVCRELERAVVVCMIILCIIAKKKTYSKNEIEVQYSKPK